MPCMSILKKLTPYELAEIRTSPKQLNPFWQSYFEKITLDLNKQFFSFYRQFPNIRFINRQVVTVKDFLNEVSGEIRLYQVLPHGSVGILHFPDSLVESLIVETLGGGQRVSGKNVKKIVGKVGGSIIDVVMEKVIKTMSLFFEEQNRYLELVIVNRDSNEFIFHGLNPEEHLSIQQFSLSIEDQTYYFELGLSNQLLESFKLI